VRGLPHAIAGLRPPPSADVRTDAVERAWVDRIRAGDAAAFEALYRAYWHRLYAFAYRYVPAKEDAEEVVQDVFLRIWRRRESWLPVGTVRNYLYCAVRNTARDRVERAVIAQRWRDREVALLSDRPAVTGLDVEAYLEAADVAARVERALAELPSRRGAVCRLRLIDGLSYTEIGHRLGICEKTVETQLARGLKFLRDRLGG
jgi:RNA polymerase sigma-70 factor, ECF subfamily